MNVATDTASMTSLRTTIGAVVLTTLGVLPVFFVGALGPFVTDELGINAAGFGFAIAAYFATSALASAPGGRLVERLGSRRGGVVAGTLSVGALLTIGVFASTWLHLVLILGVAGVGNAIAQLASNLAVARGVVVHRQGLAYGVKQAAIPLATLAGGASVPLFALGPGWRWAFAIGPVMFAIWAAVSPRSDLALPARRITPNAKSLRSASLVVLAVATGLAAAASNALGAFFVTSAIDASVAAPDAGLLLVVGSCCGIASRVLIGWKADHMAVDRMLVVAGMMAGGSIGLAALATAAGPLLVVGVVVAFAAGWGWTGLLSFAVVRDYPASPAAATGITQAGLYLGGVIGPIGFGLIVEHGSYAAAWSAASAVLLAAGVLIALRSRSSFGRVAAVGPVA
jgi:MFS family permease